MTGDLLTGGVLAGALVVVFAVVVEGVEALARRLFNLPGQRGGHHGR